MLRRHFFKSFALLPFISTSKPNPKPKGIGILRFPNDQRDIAQQIGEQLQDGGILCLSDVKDQTGNYVWDYVQYADVPLTIYGSPVTDYHSG